MKQLVVLFFLHLIALMPLSAQVGNEWINFSQKYVRIPVGKDGIYRITPAALQAAGFPVNSDPKKLQLFHRGIEQAILVTGESDGVLNAGDFIEFYGRKNDGTLDKELYTNPDYQPHLYYNLFNDTTSYFLTNGASQGKRMEFYQESNASALSPQAYHLEEKQLILSNDYSIGVDYGEVISSSFDEGEGWMSPMMTSGQASQEFTISGVDRRVTSAEAPVFEFALTGRGRMNHAVEIYIGPSSRLLTTATFSGYATFKLSQAINWSDIGSDGVFKVGVKVIGTGGPDRVSLNYIKLKFAQEIDAANNPRYVFNLKENPGGKSYVEIKNFTNTNNVRLFDITDPNNLRHIGTSQTTTLNAIVRSTISSRKILLADGFDTPAIKPVNWSFISTADFNFVIISHPMLRKPAGGYSDPVSAYADYRASAAGGSHRPLVVNINDLYDQFNYGEQSPLAIFHLIKYMEASKLPDYLLIIGKGLDVQFDYFRKPGSFPAYKNLIPSAGQPASDIAYTAGLGGTPHAPSVATGRIPAMKPEEVAAYLNKVKETEARPFNDLRRKNILHLSGGIYAGEPQAFRAYLQDYEKVAKDFYLGGDVKAMAKQSTDVTLINIAEEVNQGLNLVTFFGHSSPSTLDFDVGFVSDPVMGYNNKGKYPVLLMNGCDAGAFFLNTKLFGEDWINASDKGAIGFIAHSSFGFINQLRYYSNLFYQIGYGDTTFITSGVGNIQKEVTHRFMASSSGSITDITTIQQMILLGDPAVRLFGAPGADYAIEDENVSLVSINGEPITAASDSFAISFIVRNYGQARKEPFRIEVIRTSGDKSVVTYDSIYAPVLYSDTLMFIIRNGSTKGFGNNTFEIRVDADNLVREIREDNNTAFLDYFVPLNGTQNLYPGNFSVVNNRNVTLSFQHTDVLSGETDFLLEIDTINTFDSPFKKQHTVKGTVLVRQMVQLLDLDTTVYYWRTKLARPSANENKEWTVSSFTFINNGPEGWAQIHFPQYNDNDLTGLVQNIPLRRIKFQETVTDIAIRTFSASAGKPADSVSIRINNAEYNLVHQGFGCRNNTINLVAFDKSSTVPYAGIPFQWFNRDGRSCGREPWVINSFTSSQLITGNGDDISHYVDNVVTGDSVVLFNIGNADYATWPSAARIKLGELGISVAQIDALQAGEPVVIIGKKGLPPGDAKVIRLQHPTDQQLKVQETITGRYTSGKMKSTLIGPALQWQKVIAKAQEVEIPDQVAIDVVGVSLQGIEEVLAQGIMSTHDLSDIDAAKYPYLKLVYTATDQVNLTAAQLEKWLVIYEPVAEGLVFYNGLRERSVLQEGQVWTAQFGYVNVSDKTFSNTLTVRQKIFNHSTLAASESPITITSPAPGDTTLFEVSFNTRKKIGLNDVEVFVNPRVYPEQYYDNNILFLGNHIDVSGEKYNPILDVSIDGRYIEKDDYVSTSPNIRIRLWDENQYLVKKDTTGMSIFLSYPCDQETCPLQPVNFSRDDVNWIAATDTTAFSVLFTPTNLPDGKYTLRVEAKDESGNPSGDEPYEITFQVKREFTVSIQGPYPNPVEHESGFDVMVTGENSAGEISLQIISSEGVVLQTLRTHDFPPLHVGKNILPWTSKHTGSLPGGIYIYRLMINAHGTTTEKRGKLFLTK